MIARRARDLMEKYGLSYQVSLLANAEQLVPMQGKQVVEIGGCLPRGLVLDDLGAARWIAVEDVSQYDGPPPFAADVLMDVDEVTDAAALPPYAILVGGAENMPAALEQTFDVAFSIAAFEHIPRFPEMLARTLAVLKPGGRLVSLFAPIWSAHDGHHLPDMTDRNGRHFNFSNSPIPPWGHLLMTPPQLYRHLLAHTDAETAGRMIHEIYHSRNLNRLFTEDFVDYFRMSGFEVEKLLPLGGHAPREELQKKLERRHPGRRHFNNNGLVAVLRRPK